MHATITNTGSQSFPVAVWGGGPTPLPTTGTGMLAPGASVTINDAAVGRVDLGENPTLGEELSTAILGTLGALATAVRAILDFLAGRPTPSTLAVQGISASIHNMGRNGIRALAGSNLDEHTIPGGGTRMISAPGTSPGSLPYIELRQLGMAPAVDAPMPGEGTP